MALADLVQLERQQIAAGTVKQCGKVCDDGCHGAQRCARAEHPHDPDADNGLHPVTRQPLPPGNVTPHVAVAEDGTLTQWTCLPGDHDGLADDERTAKRAADAAAARKAATEALFDSIDPELLVTMLRSAGHL